MIFRLIDKKKDLRLAIIAFGLLTYVVTIFFLSANVFRLHRKVENVSKDTTEIKVIQQNFEANFTEELFNEHLAFMDKKELENKLKVLETQIQTLRQSPENSQYAQVEEIYTNYSTFEKNVQRNTGVKLDTTAYADKLASWGTMLINQEFDDLKTELQTANSELDTKYKEYLATLPPPPRIGGGEGYSYNTVNANGRSFGVYLVKLPMSQYRIRTVSASGENCSDNCPTKTLAQYVQESNGVAGMNGTYFCPPDYSNCSGKVNTFDYAFFDSNTDRWINSDARSWGDTGMFTFRGNSIDFYHESSDFGGGSVDGAISNYPSLIKDGEVDIKESTLTSFQKDIRGTRGVLAVGGENIYLALVTNATVPDAAEVMKALGVKHALNLDGGGSSAMYINGGYVVGPGRSLPNAVVIVRN